MNDDATKQKIDYIFNALGKAEVKITTFAALTNISRATLHNWRNEETVSDQLRLNLAYHTARRLREAKRQGLLPLREVRPREREGVLRKIISQLKMS